MSALSPIRRAMTSDELKHLVDDRARNSTLSFVPSWIEDAESYRANARTSLINALVQPYEAEVFVDEFQAHRYDTTAGYAKVWVVAEKEPRRLYFDTRSELFHLAFGPETLSGRWVDLGHRDSNILDVWMA